MERDQHCNAHDDIIVQKSMYPLQITPADAAISILHLHQTYSQMLQVKCICNIQASNQSLNHILAGRETSDETLWEKTLERASMPMLGIRQRVGRRLPPIPKYHCIYKLPFCQILLYGMKMKRRLNTARPML